MYPQYASQIEAASRRFGIRPELLQAVIQRESAGDYRAVSPAGAQGLMQIMPGTYSDLRGRYPDLSEDVFDPASNIMAGAAYLSEMGDRYGNDPQRMLIGYNAGPGRADQFTGDVSTLPQETQGYLEALMPIFQQQYPMGQDVGYAPGMVPQGIMGPPPPQTALTIPPMATGAPAMLPTAQAPQTQGQGIGDSLSSFITDNPMALMAMGLGLLGAGPGQSPFAAGAQGFMSGMQMDRATAERTREEERRRALQQLLAQSGMDPATAQLAGMFPEQAIGPMLERQLAGPASAFEGTGITAQMYNRYVDLQRRMAAGEQLSPDDQFMMQLAERHLMQPDIIGSMDQGFTQINQPPLPTMGVPQGIAGPAVPETALTAPPASQGQGEGQIVPLTDAGNPRVSGEALGRVAALRVGRDELDVLEAGLFPQGIQGDIDQSLRWSMAAGLPWTQGREYNQRVSRIVEGVLRSLTGAAAPDAEHVRYRTELYGVSAFDSPEAIRNKITALRRYIDEAERLARDGIPVDDIDPWSIPTFLPEDQAPAQAPASGQEIIDRYGLE